MPKLETGLYNHLTDDAGVSAIVGDRVYPGRLPEGGNLPAVVWNRISASRIYTHDTFETTDAWTTARVQFSCWAHSSLEAINLGEAVLLSLSGYEGDLGGSQIGSSFGVDEIDDYEPDTKFYRRIIDMIISYEDDLASGS